MFYRKYTPEDDNYIRTHQTTPDDALGVALGRTAEAISQRRKKLKLKSFFAVTKECRAVIPTKKMPTDPHSALARAASDHGLSYGQFVAALRDNGVGIHEYLERA